jgi:type IV pilus assembly protein PilX
MKRHQEGAALIVGLVMLSIITLLAITALNTSSTELIMAGNEQFRERALQAADAGIERATRVLASVPQNGIPKPDSGAIAAQPEDTYTLSSVYIGTDDDIPGFSSNQFAGYHYRIVSTGLSRRNARSIHEQGAYVLGGSGAGGGNLEWLPGADAP